MNNADPAAVLADLLGSVAVARETLATYGGSLRAVHDAAAAELVRLPGIGPRRRARLRAAFALGRLAAGERLRAGEVIQRPADVHRLVWPLVAHEDREVFLVLGLDARNRVRLLHTAAMGSLTRCALRPADVFTPLVRAAAAHAIVVHNHPSGDPTPSPEDLAMTRRMREAGRLLGIAVLDHVVVASGGYASIEEAGG